MASDTHRTRHCAPGVLIVDDNTSVRNLVKLCCEQNGVPAFDAPSGIDALEILRRENERVRLVITDLVMPGMSGAQLAADVRNLYPDLPILFMSGYTDEPPEQRPGDHWMQKPLDLPRLVQIALRLLNG